MRSSFLICLLWAVHASISDAIAMYELGKVRFTPYYRDGECVDINYDDFELNEMTVTPTTAIYTRDGCEYTIDGKSLYMYSQPLPSSIEGTTLTKEEVIQKFNGV